jgi:UDP-N-acetylglucosamine transferase subunit ALG13
MVTVGSDYHPFNRLVGAVDRWLSQPSTVGMDVLVQYGTADRPQHGHCRDYRAHDELIDRLSSSDIVVTQGGPMGIVEARRCGRIPIVMPRLHHLGEVVDDHQVAFCHQLASTGDIVLVESEAELVEALDKAVADPSRLVLTGSAGEVDTRGAVEAFARAVDRLPPRRRARWRRR